MMLLMLSEHRSLQRSQCLIICGRFAVKGEWHRQGKLSHPKAWSEGHHRPKQTPSLCSRIGLVKLFSLFLFFRCLPVFNDFSTPSIHQAFGIFSFRRFFCLFHFNLFRVLLEIADSLTRLCLVEAIPLFSNWLTTLTPITNKTFILRMLATWQRK